MSNPRNRKTKVSSTELAIKVYDIDYKKMIKNMMDSKTWGNVYTLYAYKTDVFTLQMSSMSFANNEITFRIRWNKKPDAWDYETVHFKLNHTGYTIKILKNKINRELIAFYTHEAFKQCTKKWNDNNYDLIKQEKETLQTKAEELWDEAGYEDMFDIRATFIDGFICNNKTIKGSSEEKTYIENTVHDTFYEELMVLYKLLKMDDKREELKNNRNEFLTDKKDYSISSKKMNLILADIENLTFEDGE